MSHRKSLTNTKPCKTLQAKNKSTSYLTMNGRNAFITEPMKTAIPRTALPPKRIHNEPAGI